MKHVLRRLKTEKSGKRRSNRGDIMSPEKRSALMARIKGKNTKPERRLASALPMHGFRLERHASDLPGRPDFVFRSLRVVVFVDGDFWHGWRFPQWRHKLTRKWEAKIDSNRKRDRRIHRRLRSLGWTVLRIWEHEIKGDLESCVRRVDTALAFAASTRSAQS